MTVVKEMAKVRLRGGVSILWVVVDALYVGPPALNGKSDTCKRGLGLFLSDTGE